MCHIERRECCPKAKAPKMEKGFLNRELTWKSAGEKKKKSK
jgi:hypothetical protein